jgi:hypothetical protein
MTRKDLVIFDGKGGMATLTKFRADQPQTVVDQRIIYSRRTGEHRGDNLQELKQ